MSAPSASRSRTVRSVLSTVEYNRWRLPKDRGIGSCSPHCTSHRNSSPFHQVCVRARAPTHTQAATHNHMHINDGDLLFVLIADNRRYQQPSLSALLMCVCVCVCVCVYYTRTHTHAHTHTHTRHTHSHTHNIGPGTSRMPSRPSSRPLMTLSRPSVIRTGSSENLHGTRI